jgi:hypothetical protein
LKKVKKEKRTLRCFLVEMSNGNVTTNTNGEKHQRFFSEARAQRVKTRVGHSEKSRSGLEKSRSGLEKSRSGLEKSRSGLEKSRSALKKVGPP